MDFKDLHAAVIMDGNGRWASARGLPRSHGHRQGAARVAPLVEAAPGLGIRHLTLFVFSADNWKRPSDEVSVILELLGGYIRAETERCVRSGVAIEVLGRRDRLPRALADTVEAAEESTSKGDRLTLRLAVDYSARQSITEAVRRLVADALPRESAIPDGELADLLDHESALGAPDVDLLVRTGGERRLSDFLLWECAYAEFVFTDTLWPDFTPDDMAAAVAEFRCRERRFGRTPSQVRELEPDPGGTRSAPTELAG